MSLTLEASDWSFIGAVIIISLACFALIISIAYYCWLYEVISSLKLRVLSICGVETKISHNRNNKAPLPVSRRDPHRYPDMSRENIQFHASPREPPKQKQNNMLRRSNGNHNGNQRPTTAHRQTRQRAVNIAIHELKSQVYDQRESPPSKPAKSEAVKAYVKSAGASTSSVVESYSYSSTTITDNMTSSEGESESQRLEPEDRGEVAVTGCQRDAESKKLEEIATRERGSTENPTVGKIHPESFRTRKWSRINLKLVEKETQLGQLAAQLAHKPGRSTRAVAPSALQESKDQILNTSLLVDDVADNTGPKRRFIDGRNIPGSIFEVLLSLRKSGNLGINPIDNPVSRLFTSDSERSKTPVISNAETVKQSIIPRGVEDTENSSVSDEIKSSSDADTESSLIVLSGTAKFRQCSPTKTSSDEPEAETNKKDQESVAVREIPADKSEIEYTYNADQAHQNIDPSKQVFGREDLITPDLDKRESLVRRIDSLFCSTTPSSMGSVVSENVFQEQIDHNINNLNDLAYNNNQPSDPQCHFENKLTGEEIVTGQENNSGAFITQSNIDEQSNEPESNLKVNIGANLNRSLEIGSSSSSSFNSTTLPSVTSDSNTSTTLDLTSEEEDAPGTLKFFH